MLRFRNQMPLDYSMCCMTVTVYHREGLTRQVIHNGHLEYTHQQVTTDGVDNAENQFLLVVPGALSIAPGDKVAVGECPPVTAWHEADGMVVRSVKPRYFYGSICHTEARG